MKNRNITAVSLALCLGLPTLVTFVTGCAGDRYNRSTGQYIDDKATAHRVRDALHSDPEYKLSTVEVKCFRGNVQLSGFVATEDQRRAAGDDAKKVGDVQRVENNIIVKSHLTRAEQQGQTEQDQKAQGRPSEGQAGK